ncbi:hypothetical protein H6F51_03390 [Cyanobacteria bacterium FACHB-DQ100]|nr:hypothetical protein [Cyanobacteria bacterium FACHB-DQ100]
MSEVDLNSQNRAIQVLIALVHMEPIMKPSITLKVLLGLLCAVTVTIPTVALAGIRQTGFDFQLVAGFPSGRICLKAPICIGFYRF